MCITTKLPSLEFLTGSAAILQVALYCYCAETKDNTIGGNVDKISWRNSVRRISAGMGYNTTSCMGKEI
jgi:hypothetical protein